MHRIFNKIKKIHFVGIGGSGMSGIAEVLLNLGYEVSGSDLKRSDITQRLVKLGAKIFYSHKKENIGNAEVVVYSSAIKSDNPEIEFAKKKNIPVIARIEMLAEIARLKYTISICGTHGKTTTTSMVGLVLDKCGFDPTIVVGGTFKNIGTGAKIGKSDYIVVEADESDGSFLKLSPYITICTNIDNDHLDYYGSFEKLKSAFLTHFNSVPFYGFNIVCGDDKNIKSLFSFVKRKYWTYGFGENNNFVAKGIINTNGYVNYKVYNRHKYCGTIKIRVLGLHNVLNSLAVVSFSIISGLDFNKTKQALEEFQGVKRRLEKKGCIKYGNSLVEVFDDYGHHPTEIYNVLNVIREINKNKKLVVIFQPHRFSRTKILYRQFATAFSKKDKIYIMDIYPAGEKPIEGITSDLIYNDMKKKGYDISHFSEKELLRKIGDNQVIVTLGAGNVYKISESLVKKYGC